MSDPRSVNQMVEVDREIRKHWIWGRELPKKSQTDRKGRCLICELIHPSSSRHWKKVSGAANRGWSKNDTTAMSSFHARTMAAPQKNF